MANTLFTLNNHIPQVGELKLSEALLSSSPSVADSSWFPFPDFSGKEAADFPNNNLAGEVDSDRPGVGGVIEFNPTVSFASLLPQVEEVEAGRLEITSQGEGPAVKSVLPGVSVGTQVFDYSQDSIPDDSQDNPKTEIVTSWTGATPFGISNLDFSNLVPGEDYAPDQVIVKLKPWAEPTSLLDALADSGDVTVRETTKTLGIELWELNGISVEDAISIYSQDPSIEYIEPNYLISISVEQIPNDSYFSSLWGLHNTGQSGGTPDADIDAPEAWNLQTGNGSVIVGVIDTGVDYTHPDLVNNIWTNPGEIAGDGIDNDGNGYVDDVHGYDFAYEDNDPMDVYGHGTHVAGTIAAEGNNGIGVVGVNWDAQIMPIKFLNDSGYGYTFDAIQSVEYATLMGANLTNNSWGGGGYAQGLYDAIAAAGNAGQLFIAAAGNYSNNNDIYPFYPASYTLDNVIAVAATDRYDNLSSFSNYGPNSVDLGAPGSDILSTIPGGGYATYSGTSMATPHVSGVAALVWAEYPDLTADEVKQLLLGTTDPIPALQGKTVSGGRLNAYNAIVGGNAGQIKGSKWNDLNQNGLWEISEPALKDWKIYLDSDNDGQLDPGEPFTTTKTDGSYAFNFLPPGTYKVGEVVQPGWAQTYPSGTHTVKVLKGQIASDINFGNFLAYPATIQGTKWKDLDADGIRDANETGLAGWTIYLDKNQNGQLDSGESSTITNASGNYSFTGLVPGTYTVAEVLPAGWEQTYPGGGSSLVFNDPYGDAFGYYYYRLDIKSLSGSVSAGKLNLTMDFFTPIAPPSSGAPYSVVGYWDLDLDQNSATGGVSHQSYYAPPGQQGGPLGVDTYIDLFSESSHPGLVNLVGIGTVPISYSSNSFQVQIPLSLLGDDGVVNYGSVIGSFYEPTDAAPNTQFGTSSASGTHTVELSPNEIATNINFGNRELPPSEIHGSKWNDLNSNGIWNADEFGLAGWTIYLDQNQNGQLDGGETSTLTDTSGNYAFTDLDPGTYTVAEVMQASWQPTYPVAFQYEWSDSNQPGGPSFNWIDISGVGTPIYLSDDSYTQVTLPFTFPFYGEEKNTVKISSNGYLTFGSNGSDYTNDPIPNSNSPNDFIAPFWDDLNPGAGGLIYSHYNPVQNQFIVQYQGVPRFYNEGSLTFEAILKPDGSILYQYDNLNATLNSATIGVENTNGMEGVQIAYNQNYVHNDLAVSIEPLLVSIPHTVELSPGEIANDVNFGNREILPAEIHGTLWNDQNGNSVHDVGEPALANWFLYLDENQNSQLDPGETTAHTDIYGHYAFTGLMPDTYTVAEALCPGWAETYPGLGNRGFETGNFTGWQVLGSTSIQTASYGSVPTEGIYQALLANWDGSVSDAQIETFLSLNPGSLDSLGNGNATEGSAIAQTLTVSAGDQVSFNWNFLTDNYSPFHDFAFVSIASPTGPDTTITLANVNSYLVPSPTPFYKETGFGTFSYTFPTSGPFTLGVGVMDVIDTVVDSGVLVDNFSFTGKGVHTVTLESGQIVTGIDFEDHQTSAPTITYGTKGNDNLTVTNSPVNIYTLGGNDAINGAGSSGGNAFYGGGGNDTLFGNYYDHLSGGPGDDLLDTSNGSGFNSLYGDDGKDILKAGKNDWLDGGSGNDLLYAGLFGTDLTGGLGSDQFWMVSNGQLPLAAHTIEDFEDGIDRIGIGGLGISPDIAITQVGDDTLLSALNTELAVLKGIPASVLSSSDFIFAV